MIIKNDSFTVIFLDSVDSTHKYLKNYIQNSGYKNPQLVITQNQTNGIGSRDNKWIGKKNNLYFSFVLSKELLPDDLPIQSASIYFSYLLAELLKEQGSSIWLKWPNDFYINGDKIGGTITNFKNDLFYCGIGLNLVKNNHFNALDISIDVNNIIDKYTKIINKKYLWKKIFSKYLLEFKKSKHFSATVKNQKISLENAILNEDGSIDIDNEKVFSLR